MPGSPRISVVVTVRNEQENVKELARRLRSALAPEDEIIFIDDGSTDETWARLLTMHEPGRLRIARLRGRFGKTAALMAGFAAARGTSSSPWTATCRTSLPRFPASSPNWRTASTW